MPIFSIDIEKRNGAAGIPFWSNNYHVDAVDIFATSVAVDAIVTEEIQTHSPDVYFTKARVSTAAEGDDTFVTRLLNMSGQRGRLGEALPLFLAVRMDFTATVGRGGRKFYHLGAGEADQSAAEWSLTLLADLVNAWTAAINELSGNSMPLTSPNGATTYNNVTAFLAVTQHQFRRGSRRNTPILP